MGAVQIHCPNCDGFNYCKSIPTYKLYHTIDENDPKSRHLCKSEYPDVQWYRRGRKCQICGNIFLSAELSETFVEELVRIRTFLIGRNQLIVKKIRRSTSWLKYNEDISLEFVQQFIRACAWWDKHPCGFPCRAPRHADNIYLSQYNGWSLDYGANTFLVGKAVKRCAKNVNSFLDEAAKGKLLNKEKIKETLGKAIAGSVANIYGDEYDSYPINDGQLEFGTHAIRLEDAADFLIKNLKFEDILI
jgi:hypothetical protein